jgi:hypothetical protein
MPNLEIKEELVIAIKEEGQDVDQFANKAIEDALKAKKDRIRKFSSDQCCFADYHCTNY